MLFPKSKLTLDLIIPYTLVLWFYSYFQIAFVHIYYEIKIINQDRSHKHIPTNKIQLENFLDNTKLWQNFKIFGQLIKLEYMRNAIAIWQLCEGISNDHMNQRVHKKA